MAYYQRRWNYPRKNYRRRYRRNKFGYWRPRRFVRRYRRRTWVRRKPFKLYRRKKLRTIRLKQWQPLKIRKCKIIGFLELLETSYGHISNNYTAFKESYVPPHQPGGGGWGMQQLTLGNLYVQNVYCMNYWTKSNRGFNLCRYLGAKFTLYRQQNVDWIFTYNLEEPLTITKYTYASYHPYKMFTYKKKIVLPSYETAPLKKKRSYKKYIKPPKKLTNQWYFQNHLQNTPLITFFATACSLKDMFVSHRAKNNNITLNALNTKFFQHPIFQYPSGTQPQAFHPDKEGTYTIWAQEHAILPTQGKGKNLTLLGETKIDTEGVSIEDSKKTTYTEYTKQYWGNVFHFNYLLQQVPTYILTATSTETPIQHMFTYKDTDISAISGLATKFEPFIIPVRYNPNKDKGIGNVVYFKNTYAITEKNWDEPKDEEIILRNFPLWLMLWGYEDYILKYNKINNLNENGILVIKSPYFNESLPAYVFLSDNFINGQGPYDVGRDERNTYTINHWYPRWEFQKEAIEEILMTGPGVARPPPNESIQAHLKYEFFFKWGGNPSTMETVYDPNSQPVGPDPSNQLLQNEIVSPTTSIEDFIYNWETRRNTLTQAATTRIIQIPPNEQSLFTDGTTTATDIPLPQKAQTQAKTTQEEEEAQLLQQLQLLEQHNQQLQLRFRQLKTLIQNFT
nr:MAG: ORF1 [TTV-like mini virus]